MKKFLRAFIHATQGIRELTKTETNFKVQLIMLIIAVGVGYALNIALSDWLTIGMVSGFVLFAEAVNTSIEKLCDEVTLERKDSIRSIKDISAGAVLISSMTAALSGILIFAKYL